MRRRPRVPAQQEARDFGRLIVDPVAREVKVDGEDVELTKIEFDILDLLSGSPRRTFTREQLLEQVWGEWFGDDHVIEVHMGKLRKKLGESASQPRHIRTAARRRLPLRAGLTPDLPCTALINEAMRRLVSETSGAGTWVEIAARADAPETYRRAVTTTTTRVTYALVGAASEVLATPASTTCCATSATTGRTRVGPENYADILGATGTDVVSVLRNLDEMHARLQSLYPELRPPSFSVTDEGRPASSRSHYSSERDGTGPLRRRPARGARRPLRHAGVRRPRVATVAAAAVHVFRVPLAGSPERAHRGRRPRSDGALRGAVRHVPSSPAARRWPGSPPTSSGWRCSTCSRSCGPPGSTGSTGCAARDSMLLLRLRPLDPACGSRSSTSPSPSGVMLLGTPVVSSSEELDRLGLSAADFSPIDQTPDLLLLRRGQERSLADLRTLNAELQRSASELRRANRCSPAPRRSTAASSSCSRSSCTSTTSARCRSRTSSRPGVESWLGYPARAGWTSRASSSTSCTPTTATACGRRTCAPSATTRRSTRSSGC